MQMEGACFCPVKPPMLGVEQGHWRLYIFDEDAAVRVDVELVWCRKQDGFVGLKNAGATCYMNSVFQQLFMQPSIRRLILNSQEVSEEERADSVFYQLQVCNKRSLVSQMQLPLSDGSRHAEDSPRVRNGKMTREGTGSQQRTSG